MAPNIDERSTEMLLKYARVADEWEGAPLVGEDTGVSKDDKASLVELASAGLITVWSEFDSRITYIRFTDAGRALAAEHGVHIAQ